MLKQRHLQLLLVFLMGVVFLAACGSGLSEDDAEAALKQAFEGDTAAANASFCESKQLDDNFTGLSEGLVFKDASCTAKGDKQMECEVTFSQADQEREIMLVFEVEDDKLCDVEIK